MGECILQTGGGIGFPAGWNEKAEGIAWDNIQKNDPIVLREYGKIEDGLKPLQELDTGTIVNGYGCSFSSDGDYLAVNSYNEGIVYIYKRQIDRFTKQLELRDSMRPYQCVFSSDGIYLAVVGNIRPTLCLYKRSGDGFAKLANPAVVSGSGTFSCRFSQSGVYLAIGISEAPFFYVYKRNGDTFTKLTPPDVFPSNGQFARAVDFSLDDNYLAMGVNSGPQYLFIYKRSGDTFVKLPDPSVRPSNSCMNVRFKPDGNYLAVAQATNPTLIVYKRSGDTFVKLANPTHLMGGTPYVCEFSGDGNDLAMCGSEQKGALIYRVSGDTIAKLCDLYSNTEGFSTSLAFSFDNKYFAIVNTKPPYVVVYLNEQKTYVNPLNKINRDYFRYAPTGKIGIATESKPRDSPVKATLFPALYNLTENGQGVT